MKKRIVIYGSVAFLVLAIVFFPRMRNPIVAGKILSTQEQKIWIDEVLTHRTQDGTIVQDVLAFAQTRRSDNFKVSSILAGNQGSRYSVVILYWIGKERVKFKDLTDLGFNDTKGWFGNGITPFETPISQALQRGRDSFLTAVDDVYRQRCVDPATREQRC
jgi:hypothetical protein